uniref:Uncharacterized protein n=1 Tax=uncultured marine virus TaxID=186617 RepID=A0A0F7L3A3_9VIRU|nr:hypothetical protein [uncultured marine virus]
MKIAKPCPEPPRSDNSAHVAPESSDLYTEPLESMAKTLAIVIGSRTIHFICASTAAVVFLTIKLFRRATPSEESRSKFRTSP